MSNNENEKDPNGLSGPDNAKSTHVFKNVHRAPHQKHKIYTRRLFKLWCPCRVAPSFCAKALGTPLPAAFRKLQAAFRQTPLRTLLHRYLYFFVASLCCRLIFLYTVEKYKILAPPDPNVEEQCAQRRL